MILPELPYTSFLCGRPLARIGSATKVRGNWYQTRKVLPTRKGFLSHFQQHVWIRQIAEKHQTFLKLSNT